ncbi:MAG: SOS response-associated peptidase family protein [Rhodobacteraceae bacterium]|nr:SOS response-associated peptidase family protein [Paracoccaceae bacterium]
MCNLYSNTATVSELRQSFQISSTHDHLGNYPPLEAIYPRNLAPVIKPYSSDERQISMMSWGFLTPAFSKRDGKPIKPQVWNNARDDKLNQATLWRESFLHNRCLIPATSYCETKGRKPAEYYWFGVREENNTLNDIHLFAIAGLWRLEDSNKHGESARGEHFTMVTTQGNDLVKPIHAKGRMPAILDPKDYERWLFGSIQDALELLKPYPQERMKILKHGLNEKSNPRRPIESDYL